MQCAYLRNEAKCGTVFKSEVKALGGKASSASKNAWNARNYDRINLTLPKGKKEVVRTHAKDCGESVNGFINRAIDEAMERDIGQR